MIFSESHGRDFDLIVCGTPGPGQADRWAPDISSRPDCACAGGPLHGTTTRPKPGGDA